MHHYSVEYHDSGNTHLEIGTYANDAFEAASIAREDVPFLRDHPNHVDKIIIMKQ